LTSETRRRFGRENVVVVAQHGVWQSGGEAEGITGFNTDGGRVVWLDRFDLLADALREADLVAGHF
jgi:hypothetical protein